MLKCEVCNKEFNSKIGLNSHICRFQDEEHYKYWLSYLQSLVTNPDITVLAYKRENDEKLIQIHNSTCGHTVWLNYYSLLKQHQSCNDKRCVSKKKSETMRRLLDTTDYRMNVSKAVKEALKDPSKRMNRLLGQAENQRKLNSPYELLFIGLLTKYNIKFDYQIPMIIDDIGCIIDFYLPEYQYYVNINSDIFHWLPDTKTKSEIKDKVRAVKQKDIQVRTAFANNKLNFIELIEFEDMTKFISSLKGE